MQASSAQKIAAPPNLSAVPGPASQTKADQSIKPPGNAKDPQKGGLPRVMVNNLKAA